MNISAEEAQNSLQQIHTVANHTRRTIASSYASFLLILWGLIFVMAYMGTYFFHTWASHIWMVLDAVGVIGTFLICWRQFRSANPTKMSPKEKIAWRIFWFWALLFIYIFFWLNMLAPMGGGAVLGSGLYIRFRWR